MITHLEGKLARIDAGNLTAEVDVGGVTYEVIVPLFLWGELQEAAGDADLTDDAARPEIGLHIFYHATANQPVPVLVGFMRRPEREFFRKFTTVEGIGPLKAAKAMNVSVSTIARAIEQEDRAVLTRMPGIGARAADKIIATLRGKVTGEAALRDSEITSPVNAADLGRKRLVEDAMETIEALGYTRAEAKRWVEAVIEEQPGIATAEEIVLAVLRERGAAG